MYERVLDWLEHQILSHRSLRLITPVWRWACRREGARWRLQYAERKLKQKLKQEASIKAILDDYNSTGVVPDVLMESGDGTYTPVYLDKR